MLLISLAIPPRSSTLQICCKMQTISSFRSGHCLHTLLHDLKMIDIGLRSSGTSFNMPQCDCKLYKWSFVNRCLFRDCYLYVLLYFALCVSYFHSAISYYHSLYLIGWRLSILMNELLKYHCIIWNPAYKQDVSKIEAIQRRFTKILHGLHMVSYSSRISYLGLDSLCCRQVKADLIMTYVLILRPFSLYLLSVLLGVTVRN